MTNLAQLRLKLRLRLVILSSNLIHVITVTSFGPDLGSNILSHVDRGGELMRIKAYFNKTKIAAGCC